MNGHEQILRNIQEWAEERPDYHIVDTTLPDASNNFQVLVSWKKGNTKNAKKGTYKLIGVLDIFPDHACLRVARESSHWEAAREFGTELEVCLKVPVALVTEERQAESKAA